MKCLSIELLKMGKLKKDIIIRDWLQKDLEVFRFWNTGKHLWMDFDGPYFPKMTKIEIENSVKTIESKIVNKSFSKQRRRMVIADKNSDNMLGTVNWYWECQISNWKTIGIVIYDHKNWTKGFGFTALNSWITYLFKQDPTLQRLDLRTWSGNVRMIKLAEKLGFIQEACFRNARKVNEKYYNSIVMGILREEWEKHKFS